MSTDVRNPKRKYAYSAANMEVLFVLLPETHRKGIKIVARDRFNKSGESTNFSRTYSGIPFRNLVEIPRVTSEGKGNILGPAAVGVFPKERVMKEVTSKGHPLFWGEWKPVSLYSTLIRDFEVTNVVDLTPGSGAACIASLYSAVDYSGFCHNEAHQQWIQGLIRRVFVALVSNKKVEADREIVNNVQQYLQRAVEAAKQMLPKETSAFGDSYTGDDDSVDDE